MNPKYKKGQLITRMDDMIAYLMAGALFYHCSHILPAGMVASWSFRKIAAKVKAGSLHLAETA